MRAVSRTRKGARWPQRAAIGGTLLGVAWAALRLPAVQRGDVRLGDAVRSRGSELTDGVVAATTELGSLYGVAGAAAALAASGRPAAAKDVLGVGALAWVVAQHSKTRVRRARPYESEMVRRLVRPPTGSSFPSGHAAVGAAMMTVLADRTRGRRGAGLLHLAYVYVAASRVYVGVHYPTDVIGGVGLGMLLGSLWRGPTGRAGRTLVDGALRLARPRALRLRLADPAA